MPAQLQRCNGFLCDLREVPQRALRLKAFSCSSAKSPLAAESARKIRERGEMLGQRSLVEFEVYERLRGESLGGCRISGTSVPFVGKLQQCFLTALRFHLKSIG